MAMTLHQTATVGSGGAASIEFTNVPQTGKDLLVLLSLRSNAAFEVAFSRIRLNSDDGEGIFLRGSGSAVSSGSYASGNLAEGSGGEATANTFGNSSFYLSNYTSSTKKSYSVDATTENNGTLVRTALNSGVTYGTAAITSVLIEDVGDTLLQYTTASLYIIS